MIEIKNIFVPKSAFNCAITSMRNPMDSWDKKDSKYGRVNDHLTIGPNDYELAMKLVNAGGPHAKFRRMIPVYMDINAPLYWWKEFDTYKVGTVANSCSTMHKIHTKNFELSDFSHEHLYYDGIENLMATITVINHYRKLYLESKKKEDWLQIIQLLPSSYNQLRTVELNYEVLSEIYKYRKDHKLNEWVTFCKVITSQDIPFNDFITGSCKNIEIMEV